MNPLRGPVGGVLEGNYLPPLPTGGYWGVGTCTPSLRSSIRISKHQYHLLISIGALCGVVEGLYEVVIILECGALLEKATSSDLASLEL